MESMGLPTRAEIKKIYAQRTGLDLSHAGWYEAFALWKTATVLEQLHHRWALGDSTDERMEAIAARVPILAKDAAHLLDELD
jgi:aminoglycoside phosphotransferase (APT) family kinase protein